MGEKISCIDSKPCHISHLPYLEFIESLSMWTLVKKSIEKTLECMCYTMLSIAPSLVPSTAHVVLDVVATIATALSTT